MSVLNKLKLVKDYHFAVLLTLIFLGILLISCKTDGKETTQKPDAVQKPNIVYILCDDLGFADVNTMAPEYCKLKTPHVDKLASEGITFMNAHSGSSVCTPTRYGLMTGRYAWRSRLQKGVVQANDDPLISEGRLTVASMLKQQGYHTGMVGKWHLNYNYLDPNTQLKVEPKKVAWSAGVPIGTYIPDGPVARGFDYFYGFHHSGTMKTIVENDRVIEEVELIRVLSTLTSKSVAYINSRADEAHKGNPFFLYVPLNSPHGPIVPSEAWQGKSGVNPHGDFVMETDWAVGEIIKALESNGLSENTLVIFTSDNGTSKNANIPEMNEKGHFPSANLRGSKADIWDGGHRVPFIVKWPHNVTSGTKTAQLICHTDFMATCAELLNVELPENTSEDGVSFLAALKGKAINSQRKAVVHHSITGKFAIRKGKWKLSLCSGSGGWSSPKDAKATEMGQPNIQLYNMDKDISEKNNLYMEYPEIVKELTTLLENYVADGSSIPGKTTHNDVPVDIWKE